MHVTKERKSALIRAVIVICALIFLYLPIGTLIVYSFNDSRMVTVWTETSLRWYRALFQNADIIRAVGISLLIAFMTACASVVIGTLAAFVLVRVGRFRGETLFVLLMTAPMVLPEVITGLALLLIFVTLGSEIELFANRGIFAIWIAHVTFCSAYTTVVIRSRFRELDISIEEAAMDLGAGPIKVFFAVILPALMPSEIAAFLLGFTMSMDDLVITSFIAGPDSNTLPMVIFSSVRRGLSPEINALATIIVLIVSVFTFFAWLSMVKKQKRKRADADKAEKAAQSEQKLHYSAPHGARRVPDAATLERQSLPAAALAVLKEQAEAVKHGQDIAAQTITQLKDLISKDESFKQAPGLADIETVPAIWFDRQHAAQAEMQQAEMKQAEIEQAAASEAQKVAEVTAAANAAAEDALQDTKSEVTALGASAKDVTAQQRLVSSTLAQAGMVKVLDHSSEMVSAPLTPDLLEEEKGEQVSAESTEVKPGDKVMPKPKGNATTASSLASAKAKQAALKNARVQAFEANPEDEADLMADSEAVSSGSGIVRPKGTTVQDLGGAKAQAKKIKATQDTSAVAVTLRAQDAEAVKSNLAKAKVVDTTERPH
ncbi:MAG: ABC transporter permease subunit [Anaerobiospirillum sp.]|nr:ABC transporter permease subunit [Anaerobiospirillum sp.]